MSLCSGAVSIKFYSILLYMHTQTPALVQHSALLFWTPHVLCETRTSHQPCWALARVHLVVRCCAVLCCCERWSVNYPKPRPSEPPERQKPERSSRRRNTARHLEEQQGFESNDATRAGRIIHQLHSEVSCWQRRRRAYFSGWVWSKWTGGSRRWWPCRKWRRTFASLCPEMQWEGGSGNTQQCATSISVPGSV